jgi:hypothetical protein
MKTTASIKRQLNSKKNSQSFTKLPNERRQVDVKLVFSREELPPALLQKETSSYERLVIDEYAQVKSCISCIDDPLWRDICTDLLSMMGAASVLKIWQSKLGEFSQEKYIDIDCKTKEAAAFVQQYDFVILGSLQRYFPGLAQLRIKVISTLRQK